MTIETKPQLYPFEVGEDPQVVRSEFERSLSNLLADPFLAGTNSDELASFIKGHFSNAETLFEKEENERRKGKPNANLFYHCKDHSVYQSSYDAITIMTVILQRDSLLPSHLSTEGVIASIIAPIYHDIGYVYQTTKGENYAKRDSVHVEVGIEAIEKLLDNPPVPDFLDREKLIRLIRVGIHATKFPPLPEYKKDAEKWLFNLNQEERREAVIVQMAVQLGDFGGQVARVDYRKTLLALRAEYEGAEEGKGTRIIGKDGEVNKKCIHFIETTVEPTLEKNAVALLGGEDNLFSLAWESLRNKL